MMRRPLIGVLALQGGVREHLVALQRAGARATEVKTAAELEPVQGLVIPGGESTAIGRLLNVFGLLEPVRARLRAGLPAFGSCAGMILLAEQVVDGLAGQPLLGGLDVTVRRNAFGSQVDSFEAWLQVVGLAAPLQAVFIRAPWVERVGEGVQVLAREAGGHPVAVRQGVLLATSFHPELTDDGRMHGLFVDLVRTSLERTPDEGEA